MSAWFIVCCGECGVPHRIPRTTFDRFHGGRDWDLTCTDCGGRMSRNATRIMSAATVRRYPELDEGAE